MGRNLSHSSISHWKLSLQFITNPPGVILFSTDGTSQRDPPLFSIRRDLPVIRNANRVQSFWQLRPSSPPLSSTRRELSLSNRRREREKITDELYSSLWNISLQDINSSIIRTSDIPSRVNHEYDKSIWKKGVHVCIRVGDFFLPFFFSLMNLICRDFSADSVTNRINSKERNFLSFSFLFCPLSREKFLSSILKSIAIRYYYDTIPIKRTDICLRYGLNFINSWMEIDREREIEREKGHNIIWLSYVDKYSWGCEIKSGHHVFIKINGSIGSKLYVSWRKSAVLCPRPENSRKRDSCYSMNTDRSIREAWSGRRNFHHS